VRTFRETPVVALTKDELIELAWKTNFLPYDQYPNSLRDIAQPMECGALMGNEKGWIGRAELDECMGRFALKT
jgi:hypothetical protein